MNLDNERQRREKRKAKIKGNKREIKWRMANTEGRGLI